MPRRRDTKLYTQASNSQLGREGRNASKKLTTLYDAVAGKAITCFPGSAFYTYLVSGRVTSEGFLPTKFATSKYRDTISHSTQPIPPEKALFRLKGRAFSGDNDPYWAHEHLAPNQQLPDSDLLKAIHAYASDYYSRTFGEGAVVDFHSLDETALLCLGILLEEMADEVLGETRDLAFTEGEIMRPETEGEMGSRGRSGGKSTVEARSTSAPRDMTAEENSASAEPRGSKRRKMGHHNDDG